jgi:hypothetical protein
LTDLLEIGLGPFDEKAPEIVAASERMTIECVMLKMISGL